MDDLTFQIPSEILDFEIMPRVERSYLFVFSKVNKSCYVKYGDLTFDSKPLDDFALNGHLDLIKWDQTGPAPSILSEVTMRNGARGGSLDVVRYLASKNCPLS